MLGLTRPGGERLDLAPPRSREPLPAVRHRNLLRLPNQSAAGRLVVLRTAVERLPIAGVYSA